MLKQLPRAIVHLHVNGLKVVANCNEMDNVFKEFFQGCNGDG